MGHLRQISARHAQRQRAITDRAHSEAESGSQQTGADEPEPQVDPNKED